MTGGAIAIQDSGWARSLEEVKERLGVLFARIEPRRAVWAYLDGLLSGVERKTGWQLAERAGDPGPWRIQAVLGRGRWDADATRDLVRSYVVGHLGAEDGVLVVDETGFVKKGDHSVGVARQYSGTAGRIENCQIGVFLGYASRRGHALIDRRLYLPEEWMADAVYGSDKQLRMMLERRDKHYVLAVRSNERLMADDRELGHARGTAAELAQALPASSWTKLSAGLGAKGPRVYDWARIRLRRLQRPPREHWLLVRRNRKDPTDCAYYVVFAPTETPLSDLARVAGQRWTIEECFQAGKGEVGLDHCEARSWHGWLRHVTLAMLALAFLTAMRTEAASQAQGKRNKRSPPHTVARSSRSPSRRSAP